MDQGYVTVNAKSSNKLIISKLPLRILDQTISPRLRLYPVNLKCPKCCNYRKYGNVKSSMKKNEDSKEGK